MNLTELFTNRQASSESVTLKRKGYGEAGEEEPVEDEASTPEEDIPTGEEESEEASVEDNTSEEDYMATDDEDGTIDESGDVPTMDEPVEDSPMDSNALLNDSLKLSYKSLYKTQKVQYDRLVNENLSSSDVGTDVEVIIKQYKKTLLILYNYIIYRYETESIAGRIEKIAEFKTIFKTLIDSTNMKLRSIETS